MAKVLVLYYSSWGHLEAMAKAAAEGAKEAGATVSIKRVPELVPVEVAKAAYYKLDQEAPIADPLELDQYDGFVLCCSTRYGMMAAQLKNFLDQTGMLWFKGVLASKVVTAFTSASTAHGGLESTILATLNVAYHWGALVMPLGYGPPAVAKTGNPYGASFVSRKGSQPDEDALAAARAQGARLAKVAAALRAAA